MIDTDTVKKLPLNRLHDPEALTAIKAEIFSLADEDDRNHVCYVLARRLIEEDVLDRAEDFARLLETWPIERTWFFGDIAVKLWQNGETTHAFQLIEEAISIAQIHGREWQRAEALSKLASHLIKMGQKERALNLLQEAIPIAQLGQAHGYGHDIEDSASVLRELAEKLALVGEFEQAKQVANSITQPYKREHATTMVQSIIDSWKLGGHNAG